MAPLATDLMTMSSIDDSNNSKSTTKKKSSKSVRHLAVSPGTKIKKKMKAPVSSPNSSPVAAPKKPKSMLIPSKAMLEGAATVKHRSKKIAMSSRNLASDDDTVPKASKSTILQDVEKSTTKAPRSSRKLLAIDEDQEKTAKKSSEQKKIRKSSRKLLGDDEVDLEHTHTSSSKAAKIRKSSRKLSGDDDADISVPSSISKPKKSGKSSRKLLGDDDVDHELELAASSKSKKIRKSSRKLLGDEDLDQERDHTELALKKLKKSSRKLIGDDDMDPETGPDLSSKTKKIRKSSRKLLGDDDIDPEGVPSTDSKSKKIRKSTRKLLGDDDGDIDAHKKSSSKSSKIKKSSRKLLGDDEDGTASAIKVASKSSKIKKSSRKLLADDDVAHDINTSGSSKVTKIRKSSRKLLGDEVPDQEESVPTSASKVKKSKMKASSRKLEIDIGADANLEQQVPEEKSSKKKSSKLKSMRKLVAESKGDTDDMVPLQPPPQPRVSMEPVVEVTQHTEEVPPDSHRLGLTTIGKTSSVPSQYTYDDFDDEDDDFGDGDSVVDPNPSFFEPTLSRTISMRDLGVSPPSSPQPKRRGKKASPNEKQATNKIEAEPECQPEETNQHINPTSPDAQMQIVNDDADKVEIRRKLKASSRNLGSGEEVHSSRHRGRFVERNGGAKKSSRNLMEDVPVNDDIASAGNGDSRGRTKSVERKKIKKSSRNLVEDLDGDKHSDHRSRRRSKSADRHGTKTKKSSRHLHAQDDERSGSESNTKLCESNSEEDEEVSVLRRKLKFSSHGREKSVERRCSKSSKSSRKLGTADPIVPPKESAVDRTLNLPVNENETVEMQELVQEEGKEDKTPIEQVPRNLQQNETGLEGNNIESSGADIPETPEEHGSSVEFGEYPEDEKVESKAGEDTVHVPEAPSMEYESTMEDCTPQFAESKVEAGPEENKVEEEDVCVPEAPVEPESSSSELSPKCAEEKEETGSDTTSVGKNGNSTTEASLDQERDELEQASQHDDLIEESELDEICVKIEDASENATQNFETVLPLCDQDEGINIDDIIHATETVVDVDMDLPEKELDDEGDSRLFTAHEPDNTTVAEAPFEDYSENNSAVDHFFFSPSSSSQGCHDSQLWKALGLNTPFSPGLVEPVTPTQDRPEVGEFTNVLQTSAVDREEPLAETETVRSNSVKPIPDLTKESGHESAVNVVPSSALEQNTDESGATEEQPSVSRSARPKQRESFSTAYEVDSVGSSSVGEISDIDLEDELSLKGDLPRGGEASLDEGQDASHQEEGAEKVVVQQEDQGGDQKCEPDAACELDTEAKDENDVASDVEAGNGAYMHEEKSGNEGIVTSPNVRTLHAESSEIEGSYDKEDAESAMQDDGRPAILATGSESQQDKTSKPNAGNKLEETRLASEASTASETETPSSNIMSEEEVGSEKPKGLSSLKGSAKLDLFRSKVSQVILFRRMFGGKNYDELSEGEKRADKGSYQRSCLSKNTGEDNSRASGEGWKVNFSSELVMVFEIEDLTKRNTSWGDVWDDLYFDEETLAEFKYQAFLEECGLAEAE